MAGLMEIHARSISSIPAGYEFSGWRAVGTHPKYVGVNIIFSETDGVFSRGPRKGTTRWKSGPRRNDIIVFVADAAHDKWLRTWERKNDQCCKCRGSREEAFSWSSTDGTSYRPCSRCGATGKPPVAEAAS